MANGLVMAEKLLRIFPTLICALVFSVGAGAAELTVLWEKHLGNSFDSCAAIAPDGTIYVTASGFLNFKDYSGGKLAAFKPDGSQKWAFKTASDIKSSPAIGADGTIYFGGRD